MFTLRPLIITLFLISSTTGWAQITAAYFPSLPDSVLMASQDGNLQFYPGGDGPGQSWNFSQFVGNQVDSVGFTDLATTGYQTEFPSAEIHQDENVMEGSFALGTFYDLQPEGAYEVGQIINSPGEPISVTFSEGLMWLPFPSSLGTSFKDTVWMTATIEGSVVQLPVDSARFERTVYRSDTIGASGSLLLSSGYYPNVLRKTTTDIWYDTIYTYTAANGWELLQTDERTSVTHYWIDPSTPFALAELYIENGQHRGMRARPFDPGPISYYLEIVGINSTLTEDDQHPPFTVNIRNVSNNLIASGYAIDSIRISGAGNINGNLSEWPVGGVATFDSVFFHSGGDVQVLAYGFACDYDTAFVHVISRPDSLSIIGLPNSVNRTEAVGSFEVHAFDTDNEQAQLNTEWTGNVNIGKKSGAGAISGTLSQPLVNGVATFDDLSFKYADDYELVAYFINVECPDTSSITVIGETEGQWLPVNVDTLSEYIERATWFTYLGGYQGISSGPSRVPIWTEIGQQFDFDGSGRITEVMIHVSSHENVGADADSIRVNIYDAGVNKIVRTDANPLAPVQISYVDSLAKHLLGTTYIREDSLLTMFASQFGIFTPLKWPLAEPIEVHGPFVMTVQLNYLNSGVNDTLILWHSELGNGLGEHRNSRRVINNESGFADGEWLPEYMAQAFTAIDYDYMFEPILEVDSFQTIPVGLMGVRTTGLNIFPTVAQESIRVSGFDFVPTQFAIKDVLGRVVYNSKLTNRSANSYFWISTNALPVGMYILEVTGQNSNEMTQERFIKN